MKTVNSTNGVITNMALVHLTKTMNSTNGAITNMKLLHVMKTMCIDTVSQKSEKCTIA